MSCVLEVAVSPFSSMISQSASEFNDGNLHQLPPRSYLVIREAENDRTFNCLAQNEAGAALVSVDLTVTKQLPEFTKYPEDMDIDEDQDLYLDCVVDEESEV